MAASYVLVEINPTKVANLLERHSFSDLMKKDINKELIFCHHFFSARVIFFSNSP
jgi:hypothetical protein